MAVTGWATSGSHPCTGAVSSCHVSLAGHGSTFTLRSAGRTPAPALPGASNATRATTTRLAATTIGRPVTRVQLVRCVRTRMTISPWVAPLT